MASELVGAVFEKLFEAVVDARNKLATDDQFDSSLKSIEETLTFIKPCILQMQKLNVQLDLLYEEMENLIRILKRGEKLISKCSEVSCCNKWRYANKIEAFHHSLLKIFQVELLSQLNRKGMEILSIFESNKICGSKYEILGGSCDATDPPAFMVGLDLPLRELKSWLLKDGESRIVVSAPGGCGKTTLAKRLCHDHQVKGIISRKYLLTFLPFPFH